MNNQGKLFKVTAIAGAAGVLLSVVLMVAFGGVTGGAVGVLTTAVVALLVLGAIAICVALAAYKEQGRKPGNTPLIFAVIAFPLGFVLVFVSAVSHFPLLTMIALLSMATSVPALIIGIVKKLSVKAPAAPVATEAAP
ncbi:hypothetical protein ACTAQJ_07970 [Arthrobacter sp. alpha11c]